MALLFLDLVLVLVDWDLCEGMLTVTDIAGGGLGTAFLSFFLFILFLLFILAPFPFVHPHVFLLSILSLHLHLLLQINSSSNFRLTIMLGVLTPPVCCLVGMSEDEFKDQQITKNIIKISKSC